MHPHPGSRDASRPAPKSPASYSKAADHVFQNCEPGLRETGTHFTFEAQQKSRGSCRWRRRRAFPICTFKSRPTQHRPNCLWVVERRKSVWLDSHGVPSVGPLHTSLSALEYTPCVSLPSPWFLPSQAVLSSSRSMILQASV